MARVLLVDHNESVLKNVHAELLQEGRFLFERSLRSPKASI
jgi:hypothetical protein